MGECTKENAFELLETFYNLGGNFIDTANQYQGGQSEEWIGEWAESTGRRNELIISTKYTLGWKTGEPVQHSNFGGTGTKSMHVSLEASLKKLRTTYIDLFYVHSWDFATGIPELMQSLNIFIQQGKVLYLGISDTPAWVVAKANCYARQHGLRGFSIYQGRFSAQARDVERDILPMCIDEGMAFNAWGVNGNGYFRAPDAAPEEQDRETPFILTGREQEVSQALHNVAQRKNTHIFAIAIAYVLHKAPYVFPLVGGRVVAHLKSNIDALSVELNEEDMDDIEKAYDFDAGFPNTWLNPGGKVPYGPEDIRFLKDLGYFDYVQVPKAAKVHKQQFNFAKLST
ncbi:uncharacterized protein A1O9_12251 [Exophiala aquamarina CBS 119918]|uniref:NADP-dependent oxidoreductase domain-containing protein n=1 Tax=Exophiala aquamarina CBS 119918 TaxID=1182545 RepID=A0A072NVH9_9EURO|nr:uncharacterized protein A1O9_12251 [Exophiala aquamarina CBS 119918]KEF51616.1 hypothetical protein A1O9_12251 [Exophiala aquamarina CBS 119918]